MQRAGHSRRDPDPESAAAVGGGRGCTRGATRAPCAGGDRYGRLPASLELHWHRRWTATVRAGNGNGVATKSAQVDSLGDCQALVQLSEQHCPISQTVGITSSVVAVGLGCRRVFYGLKRCDACARHLTPRTGSGLLKFQNESSSFIWNLVLLRMNEDFEDTYQL